MSKLATIGRLRNLEDVLKGENEMYRAEVCYTAANELEAAEATIKAIGEFAGYEDDGDYVDRHELKALLTKQEQE